MLTDSSHTPPWIPLLLTALATSKSWEDQRRRIREMLPELRTQSEAFEFNNILRSDDDPFSGRFKVHLNGSLDLFSGAGCAEMECRLKAADQLARSFGLIADRVWITDTVSSSFSQLGRITNSKLDAIVLNTLVVARLLPLIEAGIIRFRSPWVPTCFSCSAAFEQKVEETTKSVLRHFRREFRVEDMSDGKYYAYTGRSYEPPLIYRAQRRAGISIPTARQFAESEIAESIRTSFWAAREASLTRGNVLTNSRIGVAGLLESEGRLIDRRSLLILENEREITIPWVSDLDSAQIVQLREEASKALPAFRIAIARALSIQDPGVQNSKSAFDVIADVRDQALQVRAELTAKKKHSGRFWKTTYGLLGLGISAYGVATDQAAAGIAGLLPVLQLLIDHKRGHETDVAQLESKPGYVLVKAQDLLSHAHS